MLNETIIVQKARDLQKENEGKILAFPIEEKNPFSDYAVVVDCGVAMKVYPEIMSIEETARCIFDTLNTLKSEGLDVEYEKDVRFIFHEAQLNSPNLTMRKLKNAQEFSKLPKEEESIALTGRGTIKLIYVMYKDFDGDGSLEKIISSLKKYCNIVAARTRGKSSRKLYKGLINMTKDEGCQFIDETFENGLIQDKEVISLFQ